MESDSANKISESSYDQTSRRRKHLKFIITLIIFFTLIIAAIISVLVMIKRDYDSESSANNPDTTIESICSLTMYYNLCSSYMSDSLYKNNQVVSKMSTSQIFSWSLHSTINELQVITSLARLNNLPSGSTLSRCEYLLNNLLSQLNVDEKNLAMRSKMMSWINTEWPKIDMCLYSLDEERGIDTKNAVNSIMILTKMNGTETFDSSVISFWQSGKSIVALFLSDNDFIVTVCIFGWQFIFLLILICLLLRVGC